MAILAKTAKMIAPSDRLHWGECFSEKDVFIVLEVSGSEEKAALDVGKKILSEVLTKIGTLKERNLHAVQQIVREVQESPAVSSLIIGVLSDDVLYLASRGQAEVLIGRGGKIAKVLSNDDSGSGKVAVSDRLLFSSKTFCEGMPFEKRRELLSTQDVEKLKEEGAPLLFQHPETHGAVALIATVISSSDARDAQNTAPHPISESGNQFIHQLQPVKRFIRSIKEHVWQGRAEDVRSKKTLLTIVVMLLVLLVGSIVFNVRHMRSTQNQKRLNETIDLVSHQYEEAINILDLNPIRARSLLADSKLNLTPFLKSYQKDSNEYKKIKEWLGKIAESEVTAYKMYKLTSVAPFFDFTLIKTNGEGKKIAGFAELKAILDTKNRVIYSLSTVTKQSAIIAGSEIVKDAQTIAVHGKTVFILNSDGIVSIDSTSKTSSVVVKPDEKWGSVGSLAAFGGNLYLLDTKSAKIWKYIGQDTGFSSRQNYLNPDVSVDLSSGVKSVVDGSVWVLTAGGDILKFTRGLAEPFTYKGFSDALNSVTSFSTGDSDKNLYVLDREGSRIIVFEKDGTYYSQYQWDGLKDAQDIIASEEEKKIYVLSGSKIFAIDIK